MAPADPAQFEARRQELDQLLRAVEERGDSRVKARAVDLRTRLAALKPDSDGGEGDAAAAAAQLSALATALQTLRSAGAGRIADETAALEATVRQQAAGGLPAPAVEQLRWDLYTLLATVAYKGSPLFRGRIAELLTAMAVVPPEGEDPLTTRRLQQQRVLDRIELEQTMRMRSGRLPVPATIAAERERAATALGSLQVRLAAIEGDAADASLDPDRAVAAIKGVLNACLQCHRLDDHERVMRSVSTAVSPMRGARFNHKPHVLQTACETCHRSVATSRAGVDVNLPPVATCQSCHDGSKAADSCTTCHAYHPTSSVDLMLMAAR
jgi:c(7)-type cytochrome triheme protein